MTEYARVTIGKNKNEKGEPLVEAGGLVIGTAAGLREFLDDYARTQPCKCKSV